MSEVDNNGSKVMAQTEKNGNGKNNHEQSNTAVREWIQDAERLMEENRATERLSQKDYSITINA